MATVLLFITRILPLIQLVVHFAEEFHPAPESGAAKMELVLNTVMGIAQNIPVLADHLEHVKEAAQPAIETAVQMMNEVKNARAQLLQPMVGSGDSAEVAGVAKTN
jgi:hypothetical protein